MTSTTPLSVGVIGLGAMGRPMAEHLLKAGHPTTVLDLDADVVAAVVGQGASATDELAEIAENDLVLIVVPTDADVREVCLGENGLISNPRKGSVWMINASVTPQTCADIAAACAQVGVDVLDGALTGGVRGADAGEINLLVGGDGAVLERIRPGLDPWCKAVHHLGDLGAGQVGKTVNNICHWIQIAGVHEALLLGQRLGVAPSKLRAALADSPAQSRTIAEIDQMRFTWWKKDIDNAHLMAEPIGYQMPVTDLVYSLMPGITVDRIAKLVKDEDPDA
ncbi:NAD(P)-dependent oxidoreductase [Nocardioides sp.]|jgi:3-hydroxyisobutyrate dehydrogenase-like beta-hydroxyacid dehydrogenase|uniref:NAD(P)-dependent oxidoreductase n=1 Tax=Nocardioides sp. TaxID=35761 RepID=UPI002BA3313E|nr:NAD(P)-dependent oxidoreductase [Nocardioides sp.]HVX55151.1 NAD(P)-dependent oxidoreductase [Nocardioides sp.]